MRSLIFLLFASVAVSAPVPVVRPAKPVEAHEFVGGWKYEAAEEEYVTVLSSNGTSWSYGSGSCWVGRWELKNGFLKIREKLQQSKGNELNELVNIPVARNRKTGDVSICGGVMIRVPVPSRPSSGVYK